MQYQLHKNNSTITPQSYQIDIDQQYAEHISKMTTIKTIQKAKDELPHRGLEIN